MSIEKSMALKGAYIMMKTKLIKYEPQVKRKLIFLIATMLDPSLKFEYIPTDRARVYHKDLKAFAAIVVCPTDEAFDAVVKTHKRRSNEIYNTELTITKI